MTSNQPPAGTITAPAAGTLYSGSQVISYAGTASDPEDGALPASAFTWRVDFHHDAHSHPFIPSTSGVTSGSFTIATTGHTETNVWYRVVLTVRDAGGLTQTTFRDVLPRKTNLTIATNPAGLQLRLDGQPTPTPLTFESVVGIQRGLEAPATQLSGGTTYEFVSWSDGGAAIHTISTPAAATTYTATYRIATGGTGTGLSATYFNNADFTGTVVSRIDATVDFNWGTGSPASSIAVDTFSARWTGQVEAPVTGAYTFYTVSDDGVRLWVNGQQVVNNWTDHCADREQRDHHADRRAALRRPDGVLRERRRRHRAPAVERARHRQGSSAGDAPLSPARARRRFASTSSRPARRCRPGIWPTPVSRSPAAATARATAGPSSTARRRAIATRRTHPTSATTR